MQDFYQEHSRFGKQKCVQESDLNELILFS